MERELESIARLPQENPNPVIRLNQGIIVNYANPAAQMLLVYWGSTINQKAPSTITDMAVAALMMASSVNLSAPLCQQRILYNSDSVPKSWLR
jgi:nitrogen-specific signal transduction histidine kinase